MGTEDPDERDEDNVMSKLDQPAEEGDGAVAPAGAVAAAGVGAAARAGSAGACSTTEMSSWVVSLAPC